MSLPPSVVDALAVDLKQGFLLRLEADLLQFVAEFPSEEQHIPPEMLPNSYFRLLVHQLCQYYRLRTWTNQVGGISVGVYKDVDYGTLLEVVEKLEDEMKKLGIENRVQIEGPMIVAVPAEYSGNGRECHRNNTKKSDYRHTGKRNIRNNGNYWNSGTSRNFNGNFFETRVPGYPDGSGYFGVSGSVWSQGSNSGTVYEVVNHGNTSSHQNAQEGIDHEHLQNREDTHISLLCSLSPTLSSLLVSSTNTTTSTRFAFSPDAEPFYPSYSYLYYDPYYFPQFDKRTERQLLNNPYIILPSDVRTRRKPRRGK